MRFGERGAVSAAFALSAIALWGTVRASGPFSVPDRNVSLVLLQMFMATITLTNLVLAAVVLERRHVQRALQQSDERLRVALAAARARAWEWNENDPPDAVPLLFDTRGQAQHIHPDDVERVVATRRESIATGLPYDTQYRVVYHDGTMRWFRSVGRAVGPRRDRRLVGIAMDVTESKQIEDALRTSQQQLALVTDSMSASVTQCSRDLKYLWASKAYLEWCGRPAEEVINRPIVDIVGPETFARLRPYFDRVLSGEVVRYEEELELPGRGRRWIHAVYTPMVDAQGVIHGWVAAIHDIDQRKRAENALKEADRRKDEFLAILAHELRNPLAPIRTAVSLLRKIGSTGAQEREFHEIIDRQVTQMARLLDDLLDVSRITSGKIVLRKERVSLQMVITHALEASRPLIEGQRHHLTVSVPPEPLLLDADLTRLAQVFANLLNNAAKYTEQEGEITVVAERDAGGAVVHIRDNGIGIPQDMLSHVFEMFVQVDGSLERTRGGLGIGLTLVQRLVALHGGRVEARSAGAMHGSEFSVYLPLVAATVEAPSAPPTTADDLPMEARMRILVADDNADSAKLLAKLLTFSGHDVRTAFDGAAAFDVVKAFAPDVALLDIGMPKLNGYELAQRIRAEVTDRRITLVAMTGWGQEEDRRRAHEAGFDHHLTKPADLDAIEKLIAGLGQTATG
jgi:two-component system CheB/CheR fusion protein